MKGCNLDLKRGRRNEGITIRNQRTRKIKCNTENIREGKKVGKMKNEENHHYLHYFHVNTKKKHKKFKSTHTQKLIHACGSKIKKRNEEFITVKTTK